MVNALLQVTVIEATVVWNRSLATIGKLEELIANKLPAGTLRGRVA